MTTVNIQEIFQQACHLHEKAQYQQALELYRQVISQDAQFTAAYGNLATVYLNLQDYQNAIYFYQQYLRLAPAEFSMLNNLGVCFQAMQYYDQAIDCFHQAARINPHPKMYANIGHTYRLNGDYKNALAYYNRGLLLMPNDVQCHINKSLALIALRRFPEAWDEYEWRWLANAPKNYKNKKFPQPLWLNENIADKTLLVCKEQSISDEIMYASLFPRLLEKTGHLIIECSEQLTSLYKRSFPSATIVNNTDQAKKLPFDYYSHIGSLARWFHNDADNIQASPGFLKVDPSKVAQLRERYKKTGTELIVGISWHSKPNNTTKTLPSQHINCWLPLLLVPNISFVSLQANNEEATIKQLKQDTSIDIFYDSTINVQQDLDAYCTQIAAMDLVITVDNSTAHFSGSLGIPTWLLLSFSADSRWLAKGQESIWYKSLRLFREPTLKDWIASFVEVQQALIKHLTNFNEKIYLNNLQAILPIAKKMEPQPAVSKHIYKAILAIDPRKIVALNELSIIYKEQENLPKAIELLEQAVAIEPTHQSLLNNLGNYHSLNKEKEKAIACFEKSIAINSNHKSPHNNLAVIYLDDHKIDLAIKHLNKVIELDPESFISYVNLAVAYNFKLDFEASEKYIEKALQLNPDYQKAYWNLSIIHLLQANFAQGWKEYDARWFADVQSKPRQYAHAKLWKGESLEGKRILIYPEQGYGDAVQFIRYTELLKQQGAIVIVEAYEALIDLFKSCKFIDHLISLGQFYQHFDYYCPLLSLPGVFQTDLNNIPANIPYLSAPKNYLEKWQALFSPYKNFKIGIIYQGNKAHTNDKHRSLPINFFEFLKNNDQVTLFNLQAFVDPLPDTNSYMINFGMHIKNFSDTTAAISQLDLLITVDTAAAHIAGAIGKTVWNLLTYLPDWRWLLNRTDTPWYPSMRLFRQAQLDDWNSVQSELITTLKALLS